MSDLMERANREFLFGGMRLTFWHLNVSCYEREVEVLEEDSIVKWTLFEVSGIGASDDSDVRLMLRYHYDFDDEVVDRFYVVEDREDALSIVSGFNRDREHVFVGPGLFVSIL